MQQSLFRKKAMERISSPEQLSDYLKVTSPGVWSVLVAVVVLMTGLIVWAAVGTLETIVDATVIVQDHVAEIVAAGQGTDKLRAGMPLRIAAQEFTIASVETDVYGRETAYADVVLPDGTYSADIVIEQTRPIEFLLESR